MNLNLFSLIILFTYWYVQWQWIWALSKSLKLIFKKTNYLKSYQNFNNLTKNWFHLLFPTICSLRTNTFSPSASQNWRKSAKTVPYAHFECWRTTLDFPIKSFLILKNVWNWIELNWNETKVKTTKPSKPFFYLNWL